MLYSEEAGRVASTVHESQFRALSDAAVWVTACPTLLSASQEEFLLRGWQSQYPADFPGGKEGVRREFIQRLVTRVAQEFAARYPVQTSASFRQFVGEHLRVRDYDGAPWEDFPRTAMVSHLLADASRGLQDGLTDLVALQAAEVLPLVSDEALNMLHPLLEPVVREFPLDERPLRLSASDVVFESLRLFLSDLKSAFAEPAALTPLGQWEPA